MTSLNVSDHICTWLEGNLKSFNVGKNPAGSGWASWGRGGCPAIRKGLGWWIKRLVGVEDWEQQLLQLLIDLFFFKTFTFLWDVAAIYDPQGLRWSHIVPSSWQTHTSISINYGHKTVRNLKSIFSCPLWIKFTHSGTFTQTWGTLMDNFKFGYI